MGSDEALSGGNTTPVVRIGDAVHRAAGPWTETVQALLAHLRRAGLDWVPEPRGRDDLGREMVGYIDGVVPADPMPAWVWSDEVLVTAACLLRRLHDATVRFPLTGRRWRLPVHQPAEVVCHNDFAPYNFVFRERRLVGVIDFDTASPGPRVWDLAYLAYRLVPLAAPTNPDLLRSAAETRTARLALLCEAYGGGITPADVLPTVIDRLEELADWTAARAGAAGATQLAAHVDIYRADAAYLRAGSTSAGTG